MFTSTPNRRTNRGNADTELFVMMVTHNSVRGVGSEHAFKIYPISFMILAASPRSRSA